MSTPNLLKNADPINPDDHKELFEKLQGNILKGHGRDFTASIFIRLPHGKVAKSKKAVSELAKKYVTSAAEQLRDSDKFRRFGIPGHLFGNLFLSASGYRAMGFGNQLDGWFSDPPENPNPLFPQKASFLDGMLSAAADFNDRLPDAPRQPLETAYLDGEIDGMLLLADDGQQNLLREAREVLDLIEEKLGCQVVAVELGQGLRNSDDEGIEHFGYVDGRSQPLFLASDFKGLVGGKIIPGVTTEKVNDKAKRRESGDLTAWNPFASLELVLKKDPGAADDAQAFGSYYVFRKLEQDVLRFSIAEQRLADELKLEGDDRQRAGAMAVGRFRDGTPLVISETDGMVPAKSNNFRYDGLSADLAPQKFPSDALGLKCPFHAHIRKTNPRQSVDSLKKLDELPDPTALAELEAEIAEHEGRDLPRRIIRRGIPFGERSLHPGDPFQPLEALPSGGVGLLFACFQSSITRQFSFMQKTWVSNVGFKVEGSSIDPLIGQDAGSADPTSTAQLWRREYGGDAEVPEKLSDIKLADSHETAFRLADFIRFRGGEFFFAPSLPFLLGLAKD